MIKEIYYDGFHYAGRDRMWALLKDKVPECAITHEIMDDPVIFSSGRTIMDRASAQIFINQALSEGRLPQRTRPLP